MMLLGVSRLKSLDFLVNFYEKFKLNPFAQVARAFFRSKIGDNLLGKKTLVSH
jgi:hypothetical protein